MKHICIIGGGTYGSYIAQVLSEEMPDSQITILEVGEKRIKDEKEVGFHSEVKGFDYKGLSDGRFFGHGGSSAKWGGQLLFFSKNDFKSPDGFLKDIIDLNIKYRDKIYNRFLNWESNLEEEIISQDFFVKTGLWLNYFKRNLFSFFEVGKKKNVRVISNACVTKLNIVEGEIKGVAYIKEGEVKEIAADFFYLTVGAFEAARLLMNSNYIGESAIKFSDHISTKAFKIKGSTKIGDVDFGFDIKNGSLITKRLIGEIEGSSYFINPIYNSDFMFFQNLKKILFKKEITSSMIRSIIGDLGHVLRFSYSMFFKKRMYVYKNEWIMNVDVESSNSESYMRLSKEKDRYGERGLELTVDISDKTKLLIEEIKRKLELYLNENNIEYKKCYDQIHAEKLEDTYHPYGILFDFKDISDYYGKFKNMLVVSTGILPRVGGINPTATMFPVIEDHIIKLRDGNR